MLSHQVSECLRYAGKGWKDQGFSPCNKNATPNTQEFELSQRRHKSEKTTTLQQTHKHIRSHTVQIGFFLHSLDLAFAHMAVFTLRYVQRCRREDEATGHGIFNLECVFLGTFLLFSSSLSLHHSPFVPSFHYLSPSRPFSFLPFRPSLFLPLYL